MNIQGWINNPQVRNATPRRHLVLFYGNYSLDTQSITSRLGRGRALSTQRTQTVVLDRRAALECTCPLSSYARTHNIGGLPQWITSGFLPATAGRKPRFLAWSAPYLPVLTLSPLTHALPVSLLPFWFSNTPSISGLWHFLFCLESSPCRLAWLIPL